MLCKTKWHFTILSQNKKSFTLHLTKNDPEPFASPSWNSFILYQLYNIFIKIFQVMCSLDQIFEAAIEDLLVTWTLGKPLNF